MFLPTLAQLRAEHLGEGILVSFQYVQIGMNLMIAISVYCIDYIPLVTILSLILVLLRRTDAYIVPVHRKCLYVSAAARYHK